jgi:hypothetical protein
MARDEASIRRKLDECMQQISDPDASDGRFATRGAAAAAFAWVLNDVDALVQIHSLLAIRGITSKLAKTLSMEGV